MSWVKKHRTSIILSIIGLVIGTIFSLMIAEVILVSHDYPSERVDLSNETGCHDIDDFIICGSSGTIYVLGNLTKHDRPNINHIDNTYGVMNHNPERFFEEYYDQNFVTQEAEYEIRRDLSTERLVFELTKISEGKEWCIKIKEKRCI